MHIFNSSEQPRHRLCFIFEQGIMTMLPFRLNIVPLEKMIPAEKAVSSKIPEIKRELERTGHQANPLLVSPEEDDNYLLLHGNG